MNFNSGTTQQQNQGGVNPFLAFAAGAGAGVAGDQTYAAVSRTMADAKWGKWLGGASVASQLLTGNGATSPVNAAMTAINAVTNPVAPTQADVGNIKIAVQNLGTAIQNLNPLQYYGISTSVAPTTSPSAVQPATSNNGAIAVAAVIAVALLASGR